MGKGASGDRHGRPGTVLARLTVATAEDPFGPGDPLEVARLVRRTLAAAGRRAIDVTALIVVADASIPTEALGRFVRRTLGPHGASVSRRVHLVPAKVDHEHRVEVSQALGAKPASNVLVVVLGPGDRATVVSLATNATPDD